MPFPQPDDATNLPNGDGADATADPWGLHGIEPTRLIIAWPDDQPPTRTEVMSLFEAAAGGLNDQGELEGGSPDVLWNAVVRPAGAEISQILWCEPGKMMIDPATGAPGYRPAWVVGVETLLDPDDAVASYARLLRLAMNAMPDAPVIYDASSFRSFSREDLAWMLPSIDLEPVADSLWCIHVVGREKGEGPVWLHTHGLWRCGRPELEMLEVPTEFIGTAAEMINLVGERWLDEAPPAPGGIMPLGDTLNISLQRWQDCVETLPLGSPGEKADREDGEDGDHVGARAVICDARPRGVFRKVWTWPEQVIRALEEGSAVVARTERATRRSEQIARATWPELAMAHADFRRARKGVNHPDVHFLLKIGLPYGEGEDASREHMWFEVERFEGDRAEARLLNRPHFVEGLSEGDVRSVERSQLSDWSVFSPEGRFEPGRSAGLREALERLART